MYLNWRIFCGVAGSLQGGARGRRTNYSDWSLHLIVRSSCRTFITRRETATNSDETLRPISRKKYVTWFEFPRGCARSRNTVRPLRGNLSIERFARHYRICMNPSALGTSGAEDSLRGGPFAARRLNW